MTRSEFIIEAVLSMNRGQSGVIECRVHNAIKQYEQLIDESVKFDKEKSE